MLQIAKEIRKLTIECIASIGQGHIGGSFSIVDLLTVLYYKQMNITKVAFHLIPRQSLLG